MSNKQARRAASAPAAKPAAASTLAISSTDTLGRRLRAGTGALIVGGVLAAIGTLLPWFDVAGGTTMAGVETAAGIGVLVLALTAVAIGVFILLRPDHPASALGCMGRPGRRHGDCRAGRHCGVDHGSQRGHDDGRWAPDLVRRRHDRHDGLPGLLTRR